MISFVLITSVLVAGQTAVAPKAKTAEKAVPNMVRDMDPAQALAKYNELREKTPATASAQWKLGLWCEEHGLKAEAYVHFAEVVRRDPRREAAWRKLGFKKYGRRWTTDEQIAEDNEQKKADKVWGPRLRKAHKDIHGVHGTKKRDEAQAVLDAISDPRVIPSIYREFGFGGPSHQLLAIQVLGQINKPLSSKVLAMLAVYGKSPEVRRHATETLRDRPHEDFLDLLVGLMIDPLKYQIRPVGGPGSPGVLFVEGERFNVSRLYAAPVSNFTLRPTDTITFDEFGNPIIKRLVNSQVLSDIKHGVPGSQTLVKKTTREVDRYVAISPGQLMREAQKAAMVSEAQLENDVAMIKSLNADRKQFNDRVMMVAKYASGKDHGSTPKEWRDALAKGNNSSRQPTQTPLKPTFAELVPSAYSPVFMPVGFMSQTQTRTNITVDS